MLELHHTAYVYILVCLSSFMFVYIPLQSKQTNINEHQKLIFLTDEHDTNIRPIMCLCSFIYSKKITQK